MKKIRILSSCSEMQNWAETQRARGHSIGFVPTMGALHAGHGSLIQQAQLENNCVVVSIYVNPTQFNSKEDLLHYPRTWDADLETLDKHQVDVVFTPEYHELYPDQYQVKLTEDVDSKILCGQDRPGHFDGVLTVVLKLFQLTQAHRAYFGEKDFQQLYLIKKMAKAFHLPIEIRGLPTFREKDGLAMSSRNVRLSPKNRDLAPFLYQTLSQVSDLQECRNKLQELGFEVIYLQEHWQRRFVAAQLGSVRLIDNVPLPLTMSLNSSSSPNRISL